MKIVSLTLLPQVGQKAPKFCWIVLPLGKINPIPPEALAQMIRTQPRFLQLLLLLLCYDEMSTAETAEILDLSPAAVKAGLAYSLDMLRRQAEHWIDCDDIKNAFAYAIEHETIPAKQTFGTWTRLEKKTEDTPCTRPQKPI